MVVKTWENIYSDDNHSVSVIKIVSLLTLSQAFPSPHLISLQTHLKSNFFDLPICKIFVHCNWASNLEIKFCYFSRLVIYFSKIDNFAKFISFELSQANLANVDFSFFYKVQIGEYKFVRDGKTTQLEGNSSETILSHKASCLRIFMCV